MKIKATMKYITNLYDNVYSCGYCDMQDIMKHVNPVYYNCGVYGWNCDIYTDSKRSIAITTGYRNMRGQTIPHEIIEKYSSIAREICKDYWTKPYDELNAELDQNRENFFDELLKL